MATSSNEDQLKQKILEYFNYEINLEKLLWELCPQFFKTKCPDDPITSVCVETSHDGRMVHVKLYLINTLSFSRIEYLF